EVEAHGVEEVAHRRVGGLRRAEEQPAGRARCARLHQLATDAVALVARADHGLLPRPVVALVGPARVAPDLTAVLAARDERAATVPALGPFLLEGVAQEPARQLADVRLVLGLHLADHAPCPTAISPKMALT